MKEQPSYSGDNYSVFDTDEDSFLSNSDTTEEWSSIEETQEFDYDWHGYSDDSFSDSLSDDA